MAVVENINIVMENHSELKFPDVNTINIASIIDHANLRIDAVTEDIRRLCEEAKEFGFYAVCVPPYFVKKAAVLLEDSGVKVVTIAGFPLGYYHTPTKVEGAKRSIEEGADEIDMKPLEKPFVIYQGHHGDRGVTVADVVLPGCAYTEKDGLYVNTEGRVQKGVKAAPPPGEAKEDWKILKVLSDKLGLALPYVIQKDIRARLVEVNPLFDEVDCIQPARWELFVEDGKLDPEPFEFAVQNFYMTDSISRHSITMAKCVQQILNQEKVYD